MRKAILIGLMILIIALVSATTPLRPAGNIEMQGKNITGVNWLNASTINVSNIYQNGYKITRPYDIVICRNNDTGCDIICTDSDCSDDIQSVFNNANEGDIIYFKAGNYPVKMLNVTKSNLKILGAGIGKTIFTATGSGEWMIQIADVDNITFEGFTIDGDYQVKKLLSAGNNTNLFVRDNDFKNSNPTSDAWCISVWDGINGFLTRNVVFENNIVENCPCTTLDQVAFSYCDGVKIKNNIFRNLGRVVTPYHSKNVEISGNTFQNFTTYGSLVIEADNVTVTNNFVDSNSQRVYLIDSSSAVVQNNIFYVPVSTVSATDSSNVDFSNNFIKGGSYALYIRDIRDSQFTHNTIIGQGDHHVVISPSAKNIKVDDNFIFSESSLSVSMLFIQSNHTEASGNNIRTALSSQTGIRVTGENNSITNNQINATGGYAIYDLGQHNHFSYNTILAGSKLIGDDSTWINPNSIETKNMNGYKITGYTDLNTNRATFWVYNNQQRTNANQYGIFAVTGNPSSESTRQGIWFDVKTSDTVLALRNLGSGLLIRDAYNKFRLYSNGNIVSTGNLTAGVDWTNLQSYPVACPSGSAVTQLDDTITCTDSWVDISGDTMTGNLTMQGYISYNESKSFSSLYQLVSKEYVDNAVTSLGARYYMSNMSSGISDYKLTSLDVPSDTEKTLTFSSVTDGQYLAGWISSSTNEPDKLIAGLYDWRIYAEKISGTKNIALYWKMYERLANGTEILIGTSVISNEVENGVSSFIVPLSISEDVDIANDSRVIGKIYASVSGGGSAPSIRLYIEGNKDSHWLIPTNLEILDNTYLKLDGSNSMTGNLNMGSNSITNANDINSTEFYENGNKVTMPFDEVVCRNNDTGCNIVCSDSDCSDEIQSAINTVSANGGGVVYLKAGTYPIITGIVTKSNIQLIGAGTNRTVLLNRMTNSGNNYIIKNENAFTTNIDRNIGISDLTINYDYYYPTATYYPMVAFNDVIGLNIHNIELKNHKGSGGHFIQICQTDNVFLNNIYIHDAQPINDSGVYKGGDGLSLGECSGGSLPTGNRNVFINNLHIYNTVDDALLIQSGNSQNLNLNNFVINKSAWGGSAISLYGGKEINFDNGIIYDSSDANAFAVRQPMSNINVNNLIIHTEPWLGKDGYSPVATDNAKALYLVDLNDSTFSNIQIYANSTYYTAYLSGCKNLLFDHFVIKQVGRLNSGQTIRVTTSTNINFKDGIIDDNQPNTGYNFYEDASSDMRIIDVNFVNKAPTAIFTSTNGGFIKNCKNANVYVINEATTFVDNRKYTSLPTCTTNGLFDGQSINYYDGTHYNRCSCISGAWRCVYTDDAYILNTGDTMTGNLDMNSNDITSVNQITLSNGGTITGNSTCLILTSPDGTGKVSVCNI